MNAIERAAKEICDPCSYEGYSRQQPFIVERILRAYFPAEPAERADQWRTIESAPKDGTRILAAPHKAVGSPGWFIAHWGSGHFGGMGGMPGQFKEGWLDGPFFAGPQPTHWQPLPLPPQEQA